MSIPVRLGLRVLVAIVLALSLVMLWRAVPPGEPPRAAANAPPGNNYYSDVTPPPNIGVGIVDTSDPDRRRVLDVVYVDFKSYVKDVLPNEWYPNWKMEAYQAGAMAVRNYGWWFVNHWRGEYSPVTGECFHVRNNDWDQVWCSGCGTPGSPNAQGHAPQTAEAVDSTWAAGRMTRLLGGV